MANVLFTRTSDPSSKPVTDGQLIFDTSGNGKMYLDNGTERLEMGGALTVDATLSKTSTNPVQNKAVAGVMLDTLSDINNVTSKGFLADALAIKELNSSLVVISCNLPSDTTVNTLVYEQNNISLEYFYIGMCAWIEEQSSWIYSTEHIAQIVINENGICISLGTGYLANRPCKILLKKLV